ncbi:hypothetical protein AAC387_Pa03g3799 [Persea americana]
MDCQLLQACENGDLGEFQRLYDENNSILDHKISGLQESPLHLASRYKHRDLVSRILDLKKHTVMATNGQEDTPLHVACQVGEPEIVKLLLKASPSVPDMLNGAKENALYIACSSGHSEVALDLCKEMKFTARNESEASCLRIAITKGYTDVVLNILGKNPSLASRKDENGFSAMHLASREGNIEVIKELLNKDQNLSFLRDIDERTPLHLAVIHGQVHVVQEFLGRSEPAASFNIVQFADLINRADKNGDTVLHLAAKMNCLKVIELLLSKHGMNINATNNEEKTALDILKDNQAREGANVPIEFYRKRVNMIQQLKDRKRPKPTSVTAIQQSLMVVAGLIVTVTFQAGLNPPGGFWQDWDKGNKTDHHIPGKAIKSETDPWLFAFFMASDALGFIVSLALIPIIMILRKEILMYVNSLVVVAILSIEVTFIIGVIMISDRLPFYHVEIFLLILVTLGGICWTWWKLKPSMKRP